MRRAKQQINNLQSYPVFFLCFILCPDGNKRQQAGKSFLLRKFAGCTKEKAVLALSLIDKNSYRPRDAGEEDQYDYPTLAKRKEAVELGFNGRVADSLTIQDMERIKETVSSKSGLNLIFRTVDLKISSKDYVSAIALIDQYLKENPGTPYKSELFNLRGIALAKKGSNASAINDFSKSIKENEGNKSASDNRSDISEELKKQKAFEELRKEINNSKKVKSKINMK